MKLNDIDLNKLIVFLEVARAGGITAAAARLRLTPSAISQSIKALEESLSIVLFDRAGKRFIPSKAGIGLVEIVEHYHAGLTDGLRRIRADREEVKGQIRLGIFYGFSNALASEFLSTLHREYPQLEVDVLFASPSELDRLVSAQRLDFAINLFKSAKGDGLKEVMLAHDELWLVSSQPPPHRSLGFEELRKAPFVDYYRKGRLVPAWIAHHFGKRIKDVPVVMYGSHSELVVQLILQGVGIGVVASSIARGYVESGKLFVIRGKRRQLVSQIWLKTKSGACGDTGKDVFRERLLEHFAAPRPPRLS